MFFGLQHIDVLFYYFRKKGIYQPTSCAMRFTTTDNLFDQRIQVLFSSFVKKKHDGASLISENDLIADYIRGGYKMRCNSDWSLVDHVFFPIHIPSKLLSLHVGHWVLEYLNFKRRSIFVYDSNRSSRNDKVVSSVLEAYSVLLPYFFKVVGLYKKRNDIDFNQPPYFGKDYTDPLAIEWVDNVPVQKER